MCDQKWILYKYITLAGLIARVKMYHGQSMDFAQYNIPDSLTEEDIFLLGLQVSVILLLLLKAGVWKLLSMSELIAVKGFLICWIENIGKRVLCVCWRD